MAFSTGSKGGVRSDINITPLVDVVLVLLIIFMVMTPLMLKQLAVKVPQKDLEVTPSVVPVEQVVVRMDKEGRLDINHEPVRREELAEKVRTILATRREKVVFFDIDDEANYGAAVQVMDLCRGAGAKVIGIMTRS